MLSDILPFTGQHTIDSVHNYSGVAMSTPSERTEEKYNIFSLSPAVSGAAKPYYQHPVTETGSSSFYYTEENAIDSIIHGHDEDGNTILSTVDRAQFAALFQRPWARSLLYYHPEFPKLQLAEGALRSSYEWMDRFMQCKTWQQAVDSDYVHPTLSDPYFSGGFSLADKTTMDRYLTNYITDTIPFKISIWNLSNGAALCHENTGLDNYACIISESGGGIEPGLSTQDQDQVWEKFKSIYLGYRNEMLVNYINAQISAHLSGTEMNNLQLEGKKLHFVNAQGNANQNNWPWWAGLTSTPLVLPPSVPDTSLHINMDRCEGQRPFWKSRLLQCDKLKTLLYRETNADTTRFNTIVNEILDGMVSVCHHSQTAYQLYGASNVMPGYLGLPQDFEAVINQVFTANHLDTIPGDNYFCNPYTIDFPKPYGLNPPVITNNTNEIDTCGCKRFAALKLEAGADSVSLTSMNIFLMSNYHDSLNIIMWNGLQNCDKKVTKEDTCYTVTIDFANIGGNTKNREVSAAVPECPAPYVSAENVSPQGSVAPFNINLNYSFPDGSTSRILKLYDTTSHSSFNISIINQYGDTIITIPECHHIITVAECFASESCGTTISDTLVFHFCTIQICDTGHVRKLVDYVALPAFLSCDYSRPCITCARLDTLTSEFHGIFPAFGMMPHRNPVTDDEESQNSLWARFLNYRTGFSKNATDYLQAYQLCHDSASTPPDFAMCSFVKPLNDPTDLYPVDTLPCRDIETKALFTAQLIYQQMKDSLIARFDSLYLNKCLGAKYSEQFYVKYIPKEYHYTLYYYDVAGNLLKTMPPAAVKPDFNTSYLSAVAAARAGKTDVVQPLSNVILATQYRYNTLNQVVEQSTPDAGISNFWYDRLGRLVVSQNAKQRVDTKYSYTLYDVLGRITEVGQRPHNEKIDQTISQDTTALKEWLADNSTGVKEQITGTVYDLPYEAVGTTVGTVTGLYQQNLRNRVSYSYIKNADDDPLWAAATFYSYDIHGNVDTLLQDYKEGMGSITCESDGDNKGNRFKKMFYNYDLISGNVNSVAYQPLQADAFYHRYAYDAENRIIKVETSKDKIYWDQDASYDYYRHGPLARTVLGQNQVQGIDYAYTLQGWLKGVNTTAVKPIGNINGFDMGKDGLPGLGSLVARDAYGFSLNYFNEDYEPIAPGLRPFARITHPLPADPATGITTGASLYNGNIAAMAVNIPALVTPLVFGYRYDQLNRLRRMDAIEGLSGTDTTFAPSRTDDYHEEIKYDPNGNILHYVRNGNGHTGPLTMDSLTYNYEANSNKLVQVRDAVVSTNFPSDLDDQVNAANYTYDPIGNMISDKSEGIDKITWTVYGKIASIIKSSGDTISYSYDASGNRISKLVSTDPPPGEGRSSGSIRALTHTFYVRDARGNVMSIYIMKDTLEQTEIPLYGSSRLGINYTNVDVQNCALPAGDKTSFTRGSKSYELTNHLGNVLVTISDKKLAIDTADADGVIDYYTAEVLTANDYYPFGMLMRQATRGELAGSGEESTPRILTLNTRESNNPLEYTASESIEFTDGFESGVSDEFSAYIVEAAGPVSDTAGGLTDNYGDYRYGFNGKEMDNETVQYDYGFRIYDPRLGRFKSIDPLFQSYPWFSPYQFAGNSPILNLDLDGLENIPTQPDTQPQNPDERFKEYYEKFQEVKPYIKDATKLAKVYWQFQAGIFAAKFVTEVKILEIKNKIANNNKELDNLTQKSQNQADTDNSSTTVLGGGGFGGGGASGSFAGSGPIAQRVKTASEIKEEQKEKRIEALQKANENLEWDKEQYETVREGLNEFTMFGDVQDEVIEIIKVFQDPTPENIKKFVENKATQYVKDKLIKKLTKDQTKQKNIKNAKVK